ncbi:hypothetical protein [Microvirga splendida]|uniref:Pentapeptide repeat-containing protein n=1 Tax=Microvirga splendida TaxID=2795727 RepID=A0ABS0XWG4_9HYPH|nr:hypothetical protein [Microvirga splendida]MBJ6124384.1 hypothetical protein [Microvirga splendida]
MIKSLTILTAALTAGLVVASHADARPGLSFNGRNLNGVSENGRNLNGVLLNGRNLNGRNLNGGSLNGRNLNGAAREGVVGGQNRQATGIILKDGSKVTLR